MKTNVEVFMSKKQFRELVSILRVFTNTQKDFVPVMLLKKGISNGMLNPLPVEDLQSGRLIAGCNLTTPKCSFVLSSRHFMALGRLIYAIKSKSEKQIAEVIKTWQYALPETVELILAK